VGEKLDIAEKRIFEVTEKKIQGSVVAVKDLITEAFENIEERKGGDGVTGVST